MTPTPTPEQIEAARKIANEFMPTVGCVNRIAQIIATRDARIIAEARAGAVRDCLKIVESEPELPGDPDEKTMAAMIEAGPVMNARLAVRTTKECIAERIHQMDNKFPCGCEDGQHEPDCFVHPDIITQDRASRSTRKGGPRK